MKAKIFFISPLLSLLLLAGCVSEKNTEKGADKDSTHAVAEKQPESLPNFVNDDAFTQIDWNRTVTKIGTNGTSDIIGNPNRVGYIGSDLQVNKIDKWLWHFYGKSQGSLTVVAYHQETSTKSPILTSGYTSQISPSSLHGADAGMASNVSLSKSGKWALLVYIDEELYDTLIINVI